MSNFPTRQGRFGVHSIDHFALEIPDLAKGRHFFDCFGLRVEDFWWGIVAALVISLIHWLGCCPVSAEVLRPAFAHEIE